MNHRQYQHKKKAIESSMDLLPDEILGLILKRISNPNHTSQVCKRWLRVHDLNRSYIYVTQPQLLPTIISRYPNLETLKLNLGYASSDQAREARLCELATHCPKLSNLDIMSGWGEDDDVIFEDGFVHFLTLAQNLKHLRLGFCHWVTDKSLEAIGCSKSPIKILVIDDGGDYISDSGFSHLQNMCVLEELDLNYCDRITDRTLEILAHGSISKTLKKLKITGPDNEITDSGVLFLGNMCVLEELKLSSREVTGRGLGFPSKTMKKLDLMDCSNNITDDGLSALREMCVLEELNLLDCDLITDYGLKCLADASCTKTMKKLCLWNCSKSTDYGVSALREMCVLEELDLKDCSLITDCGLQCLVDASCSKTMKKLDLKACSKITDDGLSALREMCVLEELNLEACRLITDRGLECLANASCSNTMKKLVLESCDKVNDYGISLLRNMCVLEELNLVRCKLVTEDAEALLISAIPTLKKLLPRNHYPY